MPSPPNPTSSEPGSVSSSLNKANAGKNSNRGRGGRRGRGNLTSPSQYTSSNESAQQDNGAKSPNRRRPPFPSKNFSAQASKHVSENKSRLNRSKPSPSPKTDHAPPPLHSDTNNIPKASNSSSDVKSNIDALVERVRASAMANNRPNTPGSHIDWAGEDDNSLPDLDDWGISPPTLSTGHTMISPIIVDGLTPLPEPITAPEKQEESPVKEPTTKPDFMPHSSVNSIPPVDIRNGLDQPKSSDTAENSKATPELESSVRDSLVPVSLHPSLPPKPAQKPRKHADGKYPNAKRFSRTRDSRANDEPKAPTTPRSQPPPLQGNDSKQKNSDETEKGLSASIHAPPKSERTPILEPTKGTTPVNNLQPSADEQRPSLDRPTNRSPHFKRHPTTNQTRTHASLANQSNRPLHSQPVLTGAAKSKIAQLLGGATAPAVRSSPLSTSTE